MAVETDQPWNNKMSRPVAKLRRRMTDFYAARLDPVFGPKRRLPDAVILGTQKGGTTSLYHCLAQHRAIVSSKDKEVHFFDLHFHHGLGWYRYHFPPCGGDESRAVYLESSPYYLFHPLVPQRVQASLPQAKFIVMLRDPVTRAYSHYWHEYNRGREQLPFAKALAAEAERLEGTEDALANETLSYSFHHQRYSYFSRGLYAEQIRRWFEYFPVDSFLFLESEAFFEDPRIEIARVCRFLGLETDESISVPHKNPGRYAHEIDAVTSARLREAYREPNRELAELLGCSFRWIEPSVLE